MAFVFFINTWKKIEIENVCRFINEEELSHIFKSGYRGENAVKME